MIDALFSQNNYVAAKRMMDATEMRHEAIASNLANIETPNYKRLDVSPAFEAQLKQAFASKNPAQIASVQPTLVADTSSITGRNDGNTVQLETELMHLNQNTIEHTLETQLITGSLLKMRMAITGKG